MKIRTLFILTFSLIGVLVVGFFYRWTTDEIRPSYLKVVEENLVDTSRLLAAMIQNEMKQEEWNYNQLHDSAKDLREGRFYARIYDSEKFSSDLQFYVTDAAGVVRFHSHRPDEEGQDYSGWIDVARTLKGEYGARSTRLDPADPSSSLLHVAAPIKAGEELVAVVTVVKPIDWPFRFMEESRRHILLGAVVLAVCALAMVIGLSYWLSRPLERLTAHAQRIRKGERSPVPPPGGSTEIRRLHAAFEEMRKGLEGKKYVETYVANLTHEIKSPLSGLCSAAEILAEDPPEKDRKRFIGHIQSETARIQRVVDQMLVLSELEGMDSLGLLADVDLVPLWREILSEYQAYAGSRGVRIELDGEKKLVVRGDRGLLRTAMGSVLQNAIEFSPNGGTVTVRFEAGRDGLNVVVMDEGPGVPDYARERVFERLFSLPRPEGGRKSSGLGLSLAREIAELHGARIALECPESGGTRVEWTFEVGR